MKIGSLVFGVAVIALLAWYGRYEISPVGGYEAAYKLDRLTGVVYLIEQDVEQPVEKCTETERGCQ